MVALLPLATRLCFGGAFLPHTVKRSPSGRNSVAPRPVCTRSASASSIPLPSPRRESIGVEAVPKASVGDAAGAVKQRGGRHEPPQPSNCRGGPMHFHGKLSGDADHASPSMRRAAWKPGARLPPEHHQPPMRCAPRPAYASIGTKKVHAHAWALQALQRFSARLSRIICYWRNSRLTD
jgi:hypothetical protein